MAPPGAHVPLRFLRAALKKGIQLIKHKLTSSSSSSRILTQLQPVLATNSPVRPIDRIKIGKRWYTTHVRRLLDAAAINPYPAHLTGKITSRASSHLGRSASAFGNTLRPRLSGGALPRTAGGYSLGGASARYFSHGAVAPAQVVSQVSSAMRTFLLNGHKGMGEYHRTRGTNGRAGVRAQLAAQMNGDVTGGAGAWIDFDMSPTFTTLSQFRGATLANAETLEMLARDFAAIVSDAAAVLGDIKKLAALGDLPVSLADAGRSDTIRVHFPSCDRAAVERLCVELGVTRGVVGEPDNATRFAFELLMPQLDFSSHPAAGGLMMPAAQAVDWMDMLTPPPASPSALHESLSQSEEGGRWLSALSSVDGAAYFGDACTHASMSPLEEVSVGEAATPSSMKSEGGGSGSDTGGIYAFLEQCDEYTSGAGRPIWT